MDRKNIDILYENPIEVSKKWDDEYCRLLNEGNYEGFRKHIKSAKYLLCDEYVVKIYVAFRFSSDIPKEMLENAYQNLLSIKNLVINKNEDDCISVTHPDFTLEAKRLTAEYPKTKEFDPELELHDARMGKCHDKAFNFALAFKDDAEIVTGYIHGYSDISKYSHSWVEFAKDGKELVIDPSLNAIMNKEGFYAVEQIEPISRISWRDAYIEMMAICEMGLNAELGMKDYVIFRDELLRDLKKHKKFNESLAKYKARLAAKLERE